MTDATGRKLTKFTLVYHQPDHHSTPQKLLFIKTVNGREDDAGLFQQYDNKKAGLVVHWYSEVWMTAAQAIQHAIAKKHKELADLLTLQARYWGHK